MTKIIRSLLAAVFAAMLFGPAAAAEPEEEYKTTVTVTGTAVEDLQAAMDNLPGEAGDVKIVIEKRLFSNVRTGVDLSVPTDKGITSLTLAHEGDGMVYISIYKTTSSINNPDYFRFFANGIPLVIDKGVTFGTPHSVTGPGMTNMDYYQGEIALFGGSKDADVVGDTRITIREGGGVNAAIYGGGLNGRVEGNTFITAHGGYGTIHGGGYVSPAADSGDLCADVTGKATIVADNRVEPRRVSGPGENRINSWYNGSIYGGGHVSTGFLTFSGGAALSARVEGGVSIDVNCTVSSAEIFGGGHVTSKGSGDVILNADVTGDVDIRIGPRTQQAADFTDATGWRAPFSALGGGYVYRQNSGCPDNASAQIWGDVTITAVESDAAADGQGGICSILGGGATENGGANSSVTVNGNVSITTSRSTLPFKAVGGGYNNVGVAGGGYSSGGTADVTKNVNIRICKAPGQSAGCRNVKNVVGGGVADGSGAANVGGNVTIQIGEDIRFDGGSVEGIDRMGVNGGGWVKGQDGTANVAGTVDVTIGKGAAFSGTYRVVGGGWVTGWYGTADVAGAVTTTIGENPAFDGDYRIIGGGWASDWYGTANVTGAVTTAIGDGAAFNGVYRIAGGGWAGGNDGGYGGNANVGGDVKTRIGRDAAFAGGYLVPAEEGQDPDPDTKLGLVGGGWATMRGGTANVTGTVSTVIGENAAFQAACRMVGGGAASGGLDYQPHAATGAISLTLNGTAGETALEELFCGSLEGRDPSASANITLKDSRVDYVYDKDGWCPEPITIHFLGDCRIQQASLEGYGDGGNGLPKKYLLHIGDGTAPAELTVENALWYSYAMPWERVDIHIFDGAALKKGGTGSLFGYPIQDLTIDEGGTLSICGNEWINGSLTGGGTLELLQADVRLRVLNEGETFAGTLKVRAAGAHGEQVVATTRKDGTAGRFVYGGEGFYIRRVEAGDNYDWALAERTAPALTAPTAAEGLVYTGRPQALVFGGSVEGGVLLYSLDGVTYAEAVPTATDAGEYTVYYKVRGDEARTDLGPQTPLTVTIDKAEGEGSVAVADYSCGGAAAPVPASATNGVDGVTYRYKRAGAGDGEYGPESPSLAGSYVVEAVFPENENYHSVTVTASFAVTHAFSDAWERDETHHWHVCAGGDGEEGRAPHEWDGGVVTTAPTAAAPGVKTFTCTLCGATRTESIPVLDPSDPPDDPPAPPTHLLTADAGEGGSIRPGGEVRVQQGLSQSFVIAPAAGYEIAEVEVDGRSVGAVDSYLFEDVDAAHTITARFRRVDSAAHCDRDERCPSHRFIDLDLKSWYHDGVHYCVERGLMVGTSPTTFSPMLDTSRGMVATILWRMQSAPVVEFDLIYGDWDGQEHYYTEAVRWATKEGVAVGYGNGDFGPEDPITREQLAVMLYRYEQRFGGGGQDTAAALPGFRDWDEVSSWAYEAMAWMTAHGVVMGKGNGILDPQGRATRAEAAAMLQRYAQVMSGGANG